jgi:hypothetical protein
MNDQLLEKLVQLQEEQNQLLKKHLTRVRFSLWSLLVLTTLMGISLGVGVYLTRPPATAATPQPAMAASSLPVIYDNIEPPVSVPRYAPVK